MFTKLRQRYNRYRLVRVETELDRLRSRAAKTRIDYDHETTLMIDRTILLIKTKELA